jgi:hypothetical protein
LKCLCFKFEEVEKCKKEVNQVAAVKAGGMAAAVAVVDVARIKNEVPVDIAFVRSAVKRKRMKWDNHARIKNVRNAVSR